MLPGHGGILDRVGQSDLHRAAVFPFRLLSVFLKMSRLLRYLWFVCIVRPLVLLGMGVNIRNRERLSVPSPAIVVANHNSHLDTMVLMSLFPMARLRKIHPWRLKTIS